MENILINGEYILFDDEEGLIITNKRIVMIEADNIQTDYHCYPLSNIAKFSIISCRSYKELNIKLEDIVITLHSDVCDKISEIHECILNA